MQTTSRSNTKTWNCKCWQYWTKQKHRKYKRLNLAAVKHTNVRVTRLSEARNQRESRWKIQLSWLIFWPWKLGLCSSETSAGFQRATQHYIPGDRTHQQLRLYECYITFTSVDNYFLFHRGSYFMKDHHALEHQMRWPGLFKIFSWVRLLRSLNFELTWIY
jgi:hypothetical protein